jgi:hypothetical protein
LYRRGFGVQQDYKIAFELYTLSADQGFAPAQRNLGQMYWQGVDVTQDYQAAFELYKLAAEQGNARAQNNLSAMYLGIGVTPDYARAWYCQVNVNHTLYEAKYPFSTKRNQ